MPVPERRPSANRPCARLLILLLNVPQVASAAALAVYSIWFDRYELMNVGVGVTYTAYTVVVILLSQFGNGVVWVLFRRNKATVGFLGRVALTSFLCVVLFFWLGERFMYFGT
jgi:hypothetical protein